MNIKTPQKIYEEVVNKPEMTKLLTCYLTELESQIRKAIVSRDTSAVLVMNYSSMNTSFLTAPEMAKILVLNLIQIIEGRGYKPRFRVTQSSIILIVTFPNMYGIDNFDEKLKKYLV